MRSFILGITICSLFLLAACDANNSDSSSQNVEEMVQTQVAIALQATQSANNTPIPTSTPVPTNTSTPTPIPTPTNTPIAGDIYWNFAFSGKVVNSESGEWPNRRLIVLFLKGEEIARTYTDAGESMVSDEGVTDGYFRIEIPNTYDIPENRYDFSEFEDVRIDYFDCLLGSIIFQHCSSWAGIEYWLGPVEEGGLLNIPVPTKNFDFQIKVFSEDSENLPSQMLEDGSIRLTDNDEIILNLANGVVDGEDRILIQGVNIGTSTELIEINRITVPINNCNGSSAVSQEYTYSQLYYHEYKAEESTSFGVSASLPKGWPQIVATLENSYGFQQGEVSAQEVSYNMEAEAQTNVTYTVTWSEEWESGSALVDTADGVVEVPFTVRKNVIYDIQSEKFDCN